MKSTSLPFLVAEPSSVEHSGWRLVTDASFDPVPPQLRSWDYQTVLHLEASVRVRRDEVAAATQLPTSTPLSVVVIARSSKGVVRSVVSSVSVPVQPVYDVALSVRLPGQSLGGRLFLTTFLVAIDPREGGPVSPFRPYQVLWETEESTLLEGHGSQFPTDAADFAVTLPSLKSAAWYLEVDLNEPDAAFLGAVRLTINSGSDIGKRLLAGANDPEADRLQHLLRWDITRQLASRALDWDEIDDSLPDFSDPSTKATLRSILASIWPNATPSAIRVQRRDQPDRFEAHLQNHARIAN